MDEEMLFNRPIRAFGIYGHIDECSLLTRISDSRDNSDDERNDAERIDGRTETVHAGRC